MALPSKYILSIHIIGWLFFLLLPLAFISTQGQSWQIVLHQLPVALLYFSIYPFIFYLHTYWLFPKLYMAKKYGAYLGCVVVLAAAVIFLKPFDRTVSGLMQPRVMQMSNGMQQPPNMLDDPFDERQPPSEQNRPPAFGNRPPIPPGTPPNSRPQQAFPPQDEGNRGGPLLDIVSILFFALTIGLSVTVQATRRWRQAIGLAAQAETEKVNAELSFLKAQINPHFLFNTLNNIYSLALSKDDNTADSIMKLSNIMRYVTDDVTSDFVSLESEVECITDYIDLQRLRVGKKTTIDFSVQGNLSIKKIAPLVMMTFVENAFKYGVSSHEASPITVRLFADERSISFFCQNRIFQGNEIKESTGIGIANTHKRLMALYPNRHLLNVTQVDGLFTVSLTLQE